MQQNNSQTNKKKKKKMFLIIRRIIITQTYFKFQRQIIKSISLDIILEFWV